MKSRFINNAVCGLTATALLGLGMAGMARADGHTMDELRQQLRAITERLQELEAKQAETEERVDDTRDRAILSTGSSPGSFLIPGTNTEFTISGYAKADFIYDLKQKDGSAIYPAGLNMNPGDEQGHFQAHARQSRLKISTSTPTVFGDLNTVIETDFYGSGGNENQSNSYGMRLRNAYVQIGGLLAGQYWTNFGTLAAYPGTVDFEGPSGITFIRQAQVRWTQSLDEKLNFAVSLENPEASSIKSVNGMGMDNLFKDKDGKDKNPAFLDRLPDAVVALEYNDDWGQFRLSALGRQLTSPDDKQDELAYGINVGGTYAIWPGGNILGNFTYGDGIGRYLIDGVGEDAIYDVAAQRLETKKAFGMVAGINHKFTDTVMGQVVVGRHHISDSNRLQAGFKKVNTVHTSLFWSPLSRLTIGGEVVYYDREVPSGDKIENIRLQTSIQVSF